MTIPLVLDGAFDSEQALRDMIVHRRVCFDHNPFYVKDGSGRIVQIGFQLGAKRGIWDDPKEPYAQPEDRCEDHAWAATSGP